MTEDRVREQLTLAMGTPSEPALVRSRNRVRRWFEEAAPQIRWDVIDSPLGQIYFAASARGLCSVGFGAPLEAFLGSLDPLASAQHDQATLAPIALQLREYFSSTRKQFDLPVDLTRLTLFQQSVLRVTREIPAGSVRTYGQIAKSLGKPQASRAVGQALGHNPVPIIIPCHRVVAGDGRLGGYSGGGGLVSKRWLLTLEGAAWG